MMRFFDSTFFDTDYLRKCVQLSLKFVCWSINNRYLVSVVEFYGIGLTMVSYLKILKLLDIYKSVWSLCV